MARRRSLRSGLCRGARLMGDMEAAQKGPTPYGKRVMRKQFYRRRNPLTRQRGW